MKKFSSILLVFLFCIFSSTMLVGCKKAQELTTSMITLEQTSYVYDGTAKEPKVTVTANEKVVDSKLYSVTYSNNVNAGKASVTITTLEKNKKISGSVSVEFDIVSAELMALETIDNVVYNGEKQVPEVTITGLTLDTDFSISYEYKEIGAEDSTYTSISVDEIIDAGVYRVSATGKGNYAGVVSTTYTIEKATYSNLTVSRADYSYVSPSDIVLSSAVNGNVKYYYSSSQDMQSAQQFNKDTVLNAGEYYFNAVVEETKNYNSFTTSVASFTVNSYDISQATLIFDKDVYEYTGLEIIPIITVKVGDLTLENAVDYSVSYSNNVNAGTANAVVTGLGNFTSTKTSNFVIEVGENPCLKHTEEEPVVENFVHATIGQDGSYDSVVYCEICDAVISKTSHTIDMVKESDISLEYSETTYIGSELTPVVSILNLELSVDFSVSYENNTNVGTANVNITFIGDYKGTYTKVFEINPALVEKPEVVGTYTYTGEEQSANLSVEDEDGVYTVTGNAGTNAGTYEVTVKLNDTTNYNWIDGTTEDLTLYFEINPALVEKPEVVGTYTYTGEEQSANLSVEDEDGLYTVTGNAGTNAGTYEITVKLNDTTNYNWIDGTTEDLTLYFEINPALVEKPEVMGTYTYTGEEQSANLSVEDEDGLYIVTGNAGTNAGTYEVTVKLNDTTNYNWIDGTTEDLTLYFEINPALVEKPEVMGTYTYTGEEQSANLSVEDEDGLYTVTGNAGTNAGIYEVTVKLNDTTNYNWIDGTTEDLTLYFEINPALVEKPEVMGTYTYTGEEQSATLSVEDEDGVYTVTGNAGTNVGIYEVTVKLNDTTNYNWIDGTTEDLTLYFEISSVDISDFEVSIEEVVYDGTELTPELTIYFGQIKLEFNSDFTAEYKDNVNAGNASVVVTGKGNYKGTITKEFEILPIEVEEPTVVGTYVYNGEPHVVVVSNMESGLFEVYENTQTNAGNDYLMTISLKNKVNYIWKETKTSDDITVKYSILCADISDAEVVISEEYFAYTGEKITPNVEEVKLNGKTLTKDVEYKVEYKNNINVGVAEVVIIGNGNYTGNAVKVFTIGITGLEEPTILGTYTYTGTAQTATLSYNDNKLFTVTGLTQTNAGTYDVVISLIDKDNYVWKNAKNSENLTLKFTINRVVVEEPTINGTYEYNGEVQEPTWNTEDTSLFNVSGLGEIVNAGTYKLTVSLINKTNYIWKNTNNTDNLIIDFVIDRVKVEEPTITSTHTYNGKEQKAELSYNDNNLFSVSGNIQTEANTYSVLVKLEDNTNYIWKNSNSTDDLSLDFVIQKFDLVNATITLDSNQFKYTGNEIQPTIIVTANNETLIFGTDYEISFENNVNIGTASANISGLNNYSGTVTKEFEILPQQVENPTILGTYVYNGLEQTIKITPDSTLYTVSENKYTDAGTYYVKVSLNNENYVWVNEQTNEDLSLEVKISPLSVEKPSYVEAKFTYSGKEQSANIFNVSTYVIVTGNKQTNAGEYDVEASLVNDKNYIWSDGTTEKLTFKFVIDKAKLSKPTSFESATYTGAPQTAVLNLSEDLAKLFTLSDNKTQTNAGEYDITVSIANKLNYVWENLENEEYTNEDIVLKYTIGKAQISSATEIIEQINYLFSGEEICPEFSLTFNDKELVNNSDYSFEYKNNVNVGNASIVITGLGNFEGNKEIYFYISINELTQDNVEFSSKSETYTGENLMPTITVNNGLDDLVYGTDYTYIWYNAKDEKVTEIIEPGTYKVVISGLGNYNLTVNDTFVVNKKTYGEITISKADYYYSEPHSKVSLNGQVYGNVLYYYSDDLEAEEWNVYNDSVDIPVGIYYLYALVEESEYYTIYKTENITFEVKKSTRTNITISREDFDYGSQTDTIISGYSGDITLYYYLPSQTIEDAVEYDNTTVFNVGTYNIFGVIADDNNYYEYKTDVSSFTVSRASYTGQITVSRDAYTYGDELTSTVLSGYNDDMSYVKLYYNYTNSNANGTLYVDTDELNAGEYYIYAVIQEHGNYLEYVTLTYLFKIEKFTYSDISVEINESYNYGDVITPTLSNEVQTSVTYYYSTENVTSGGTKFEANTKINNGVYYMYAVVSGNQNINEYTTSAVEFEIKKIVVENPVASSKEYTGASQTLISDNEYYTVSTSTYTDVGEYDVTITLRDKVNYIWKNEQNSNDLTLTYSISKANINKVTVSVLESGFVYDGTEKKPSISVSFNDGIVVVTEYSLSYENNVNAGQASIVLTASETGNFSGTHSVSFDIARADYKDIGVVKSGYSYNSTSENKLSAVVYGTITYYYNTTNSNANGTLLTDETILDAGTYYVYAVIAQSTNYNSYTTSASLFEVTKLNISSATITLNNYSFIYTGREIKPTVTSVKIGDLTLVESEDFIVSYSNNTSVSTTAKAVVTAAENSNFTGSASVNFEIKNVSITEAVIEFENNITEFQYEGYAVIPNFTVRIDETELILGEDYSVLIMNNNAVGTATIEVTGMGAFTGTITANFTILGLSLDDATAEFSNGTTTYTTTFNGNSRKTTAENQIVVKIGDNQIDSSEYKVVWYKDGVVVTSIKNAGTYTLEITSSETGNYAGTVETTLTVVINKLKLTKESDLALSSTSIAYTGSNLIDSIAILNKNRILTSSDCSVVWKDASGNVVTEVVEAGEYTAEITILDGNFSYSGGVIVKTLTVTA